MPLERVVVRNEYGLGKPKLFQGVREDPKAVFDGVAVAGLVGLLRQLGDLAEFAAEVFHGLQEEVMTTSLKSHKLLIRVKQIESALPTLEKVALAQKSHIHFCYTAGTDWRAHIQNRHNHFIHGDLPKFIMDSYEECREPPRLHMLDRFDSNGPGSCLKKYSDPTFFKKATPISDEAANRAENERKRLRRKKKRQGQKSIEVQNLSISDGIARMQIVPPVPDSPANCIFTNKTSFESGLEEQSQPFELITSLDYIECVFDHKQSVKDEEEELTEPPPPQFNLQPYENFNSDFSDDNGKAEDDEYYPKSSLQYEPSSSSTRVSWEEKTEIVNCKDYDCLLDEATETIINDPHDDTLETAGTNLCDADLIYITSDAISTGHLTSLPEDMESEIEDFMDALNTIESETECESDYQAKQEVGHNALDVNIPEAPHHSSHEPTILTSLNDGTLPSRVPSECVHPASLNGFMHEELPQLAAKHSIDNAMSVLSGSHSESTNSDPLPMTDLVSQDLNNLPAEKFINGVHDAHESSSGSSEKCSVTFWTNGGLLGLQPSKPTDFKPSVAGHNNYKEVEMPNNSAENGPNATSCRDEVAGASKNPTTDFSPQSKTTHVSHQELDNAPPMSGLAYRLFSNGFQRKLSSIRDYRSLLVGSPETDCAEQRTVAQTSFPERLPGRLFNTGFDVNSPSSSPPLEHMKISFLPTSASEVSHLKLKFHDEDINNELYGDMLPSFQLVPDSSVHPRANGIDTDDDDDDTFCRSPKSRSDDNLDYNSESSSGRWESSETPESNDHEFYDDMCRTPSVGSNSRYTNQNNTLPNHFHPDQGNSRFIENGDKPSDAPSNELPSFDIINSFSVLTSESGADSKESLTTLQFLNESAPSPPPLPPSQWMSTKLRSDQQDVPYDDVCHASSVTGFASLEQQNLLSTWQPTIIQFPADQHIVQETIALPSTNKFQDQLKEFGKAKVNQAATDFDKNDDFLQQIRTQSFNLRRTSLITSTRSNSMPAAPITNAKVTAILEKANAIRQVVASDDGEDDDDTWSE